jgi:hypothetical protein
MNVEVTSASKKEQRLSRVSSAILEKNKIRFEINLSATQKANLKLSSRLLALAKSVIGGQRGT